MAIEDNYIQDLARVLTKIAVMPHKAETIAILKSAREDIDELLKVLQP